jgi:hypothetical protein
MTEHDVFYLPVSDAVCEKTMKNVVKKYDNTNKTDMYDRTPVELLDNLYMGDIAKNALLDFLLKSGVTDIIDYDDVRIDNFTNPDPGWDFIVGKRKLKVEVKSSIPPNQESIADIINKRDIKITACHDKNNPQWIFPLEQESYIHVQIYFYATPYKEGYNSFEQLSKDINADWRNVGRIINHAKYNQPLFFGWNTKLKIEEYTKHDLKTGTWTFDWTKRIYWKCPIRLAYNLDQLVRYCHTRANIVE